MVKKSGLDQAYKEFLGDVKGCILSARIDVSRRVNQGMIRLYWNLGRMIVARQKEYGWGQGVIEKLAADIRHDVPNAAGYSGQNLWYMRQFYLAYYEEELLQQLVGEVPWGQNILIFSRIKDVRARAFYLKKVIETGWSRRVLLNQIKSQAYERQKVLPKQHNFRKALPVHLAEQADESLKSVYNLDFLGLTRPVLERELESRLIVKVRKLMLEMGRGFCFVGDQYRLLLGEKEYFIDLLFYNRILKCLVAIELKAVDFEPEFAGKMDFYLHLLNDQVKMADENPSIGIILCAGKDVLTVEYALRSVRNPVGVAEYQLTSRLPVALKRYLPGVADFRKKLAHELTVDKNAQD